MSMLPELRILASASIIWSSSISQRWQRAGPAYLVGDAPGSTNYQAGDMVQVSVDPVDSDTIYASSLDGGLWRLSQVSRYPRSSWTPLTDRETTLRTCSFAVAPSNNSILYVADGLGRILKSDNRGESWIDTGPTRFNYVSKILVHPDDPNVVYVASDISYRIWNTFAGVAGFWKTINGGGVWRQLRGGEVTDAEMDPTSPWIIYIGVRGEGLLKTINAHQEPPSQVRWEVIYPFSNVRFPADADPVGRTMIKIALGHRGTDSSRLVAVKFHRQLFIHRRSGIGATWQNKGDRGQYGSHDQSSKNNVIAVNPWSNDIILTGHQDLYLTRNGIDPNTSWRKVAGAEMHVHMDQNSIAFDPHPHRDAVVYLANDGGVYRSSDYGENWSELNRGLFTIQVTGAAAVKNNVVVASVYHQGLCGSIDASSDTSTWIGLTGGSHEFPVVYADPKRPYTFYVFYGENLQRLGFPIPQVSPNLFEPFQRIINISNFNATAIAVDTRSDSNTLLVASNQANPSNRLNRALNGNSNEPHWTPEVVNNLSYGDNIISIAFAPSNPGMAYALSHTGKVYRKDDVNSGSSWRLQGACNTRTAKQIVVNPRNHNRIFVLTETTIFRSDHAGNLLTEKRGSGDRAIPNNTRLVSLIAHPQSSGTLYLAGEGGVFVTFSEGENWNRYDIGLPKVVITNLSLDGYLYAGTMGRGLWRTPSNPIFYPMTLRS